MKSYALFQQYIWLVNTIHRARKITLEEINRKWITTEMSEGLPMVRSTFNRHKDAIQDMFGIFIECDRKDGFRYYIGNAEVLEEDSIQNWILSTMSVSSVLSESKSVHDRILLEHVPSSGENLQNFIDAMKQGVCLRIMYQRYGIEQPSEMTIEPYCVKIFNRRWYALVKYPNKPNCFMLAFDRIKELTVIDKKFTLNEEFDAATWFKDCYGIFKDDDVKPETIRIRAYGKEVYYLRDLPIHYSQKEVETTGEWSDFELLLRPSADFISPLLSRGPFIKVLEPLWLAEEVKKQHLAASALYDEE